MIRKIKGLLYFPVASYFAFFAKICFRRWNPRVIVVTGSSGKTTLLHMIASQLGYEGIKYSFYANSSYGVPFDILGLKRETYTLDEWIPLFLKTPFKAFRKPPSEKMYIVEADTDRPYEGKFLSELLKPEATLWVSVGKTHSMNFDRLLHQSKFPTTEEAVAYEFGYFIERASKLTIVNGDSKHIIDQLRRANAKKVIVSIKDLQDYHIDKNSTQFKIKNQTYTFNCLLPRESFYAIAMTMDLLKYLKVKPDLSFSKFKLPPARSSLFKGIKNTTIIDSTYNAYLGSMTAILNLYDKYPAETKWAVLADMIEQGEQERIEHEKLADIIAKLNLKRLILMGPRMKKYAYPKLKKRFGTNIMVFETPIEVLNYLKNNIKGGETILFKGARFLEGVIENLLANKEDVKKLGRREKIWEIRRRRWGL